MSLPPGQRALGVFPRFGTHLHRRPPRIPADFALEVTGAVSQPVRVDLGALPRREQLSDFHCVAGWSATGLRWEGVPFRAFYEQVVAPVAAPGVTHIGFRGLDRFRSIVTLEDALADDVLIADRLDGEPLDGDHGAPVRLVSPSQYGYKSTKHLCRVEVHTSDPGEDFGHLDPVGRIALSTALAPHPRGSVWEEQRHAHIPGQVVRPVFRMLIPPFRFLCDRGGERRD